MQQVSYVITEIWESNGELRWTTAIDQRYGFEYIFNTEEEAYDCIVELFKTSDVALGLFLVREQVTYDPATGFPFTKDETWTALAYFHREV